MKTITCPKCGEQITIDSTLDESELEQLTNKIKKEQEEVLRSKTEALKAEYEAKVTKLEAQTKEASDKEIANLKEQLIKSQAEVKNADANLRLAIKEAEAKATENANKLNSQITVLKGELQHAEADKNSAIKEALANKEVELATVKGQIDKIKSEAALNAAKLKETFDLQLSQKDEQIAYYKDFKAKLSTKMIGESLEQFCSNEFNKLRAIAYPKAYFEKDNAVSKDSGSKGDFIFKDFMENGDAYISIMFEMKNENDETKTKHKNEDFFAELDKDRKEKGCEYAVLVSLLEPDNDYYNTGIVEVCKYEKMYVVRPQFFMTIISLLKNAAMNTIDNRLELAAYKRMNIDVETFEGKLKSFQQSFGKNCEDAKNNFEKAIAAIDKSINEMTLVKEKLRLCGQQLGYADGKLQELTIKKLTYGNPTMKALFEAIDNGPIE